MKEKEDTKNLFDRFSKVQNKFILMAMFCLLVASLILSLNFRQRHKSKENDLSRSLSEMPKMIGEIVNQFPLPRSSQLNRISELNEKLIVLQKIARKPSLTASDSLEFNQILVELEYLGIRIEIE